MSWCCGPSARPWPAPAGAWATCWAIPSSWGASLPCNCPTASALPAWRLWTWRWISRRRSSRRCGPSLNAGTGWPGPWRLWPLWRPAPPTSCGSHRIRRTGWRRPGSRRGACRAWMPPASPWAPKRKPGRWPGRWGWRCPSRARCRSGGSWCWMWMGCCWRWAAASWRPWPGPWRSCAPASPGATAISRHSSASAASTTISVSQRGPWWPRTSG